MDSRLYHVKLVFPSGPVAAADMHILGVNIADALGRAMLFLEPITVVTPMAATIEPIAEELEGLINTSPMN